MLLKLNGHIGNKISASWVNSSKGKEIKLWNAAKISRKEKLSPICTLLKGDVSSEKQALSIPLHLLHLLFLILDSKTNNQQILAGIKKIIS